LHNLLFDGQAKHHKGIESEADVVAIRTLHTGFVLTLEKTTDGGLLALYVGLPSQIRTHFIRQTSPLFLLLLKIWLLANPIHIFVQFVKKVANKLLTVMLSVTCELCHVLVDLGLEFLG
jgi:hypothetical protein